MTLYMIGLGLSDEKDISVKGLEIIKKCDYLFLESYTSKLSVPKAKLEDFYGKKIVLADRELVESKSDEILVKAKSKKVAFLVVGDVFSATTHADLYLRAKEKGIDVQVIHNTSIMTAVGIVGLSLYKYGQTASLPYFEKSFMPESPYNIIKENLKLELHTLVLLDIKEDKQMTINDALIQLIEIEKKKKARVFTKSRKLIGCARLGSESHVIKYGKISELIKYDFGSPLHCLIVPGKMHFVEEEMLCIWK